MSTTGYLSGPMTGIPAFNRPLFHEVASRANSAKSCRVGRIFQKKRQTTKTGAEYIVT